MILLKISGLAKSTYYYTLSKTNKDDKNKEIIDKIKEIFINNKERYGYRRITLELRNKGFEVNHKKVYRIMVICYFTNSSFIRRIFSFISF